jgi:hypothetical protein
MPVFRRCFMAVRKTEGREWLDVDTLSTTDDGAKQLVKKWDEGIPDWAKVNPVVRIVKVRIEEIEESNVGPVPS